MYGNTKGLKLFFLYGSIPSRVLTSLLTHPAMPLCIAQTPQQFGVLKHSIFKYANHSTRLVLFICYLKCCCDLCHYFPICHLLLCTENTHTIITSENDNFGPKVTGLLTIVGHSGFSLLLFLWHLLPHIFLSFLHGEFLGYALKP